MKVYANVILRINVWDSSGVWGMNTLYWYQDFPNHDLMVLRSEGLKFYKALIDIYILKHNVPVYSILAVSNGSCQSWYFLDDFMDLFGNMKIRKNSWKRWAKNKNFLEKYQIKSIYLHLYGCNCVD